MNRRETPPGAPHPPIKSGLTNSSHQLTVGGTETPVKPASEAAHQPGQQPAAAFCPICPEAHLGYWATGHSAWAMCYLLKRCGLEAQRRSARGETTSAGETTGGARGGSRLGNPSVSGG